MAYNQEIFTPAVRSLWKCWKEVKNFSHQQYLDEDGCNIFCFLRFFFEDDQRN